MGSDQKEHPAAGPAGRRRSCAGLRPVLLLCLAAAHCPLSTACRPNKRYDLIEAELRTRERELAETRAALDQARGLNRAYESSQVPLPGGAVPALPVGGGVCPIREISLGRGTGGVDEDGQPGDESLMVVIVPADEDRSAVKVPARATVAAWEITPAGLKNPIGTWELSADQLRPTWRSGLVSTGYFVALPWQTFPTTERVRVAVRLVTTDGRPFEADRDVTVRPVPQGVPRVVPAPVPVPSPPRPGGPPVGREPLLPSAPPPGVPPVLPPGVEELPPPSGLPERGARLLAPVKR